MKQFVVIVLVYAVGGYWIITYVKKYGNTSVYIIKHISMFYLEVNIQLQLMDIIYENGRFFRGCKYAVGLL